MAELINGKKISEGILESIKKQCSDIVKKGLSRPKLVSVTLRGDRDTFLYARAQGKTAEVVGIDFALIEMDRETTTEELIKKITSLNEDPGVTGIFLQHPLPKEYDYDKIIDAVRPEKDVEGVHPYNLGKIFRRDAALLPCTPGAVMKILKEYKIDLFGKDVVIIGHSPIVGKPLSVMMLNETATTSVCHIGTSEKGDIKSYSSKADILIVAVGKPGMVKGDWVKEGVTVIDVGINNIDGKITGDVDFDTVSQKAALISPVPGGVGPVTVAILLRNIIRAYGIQNGEIKR
jgi:methylenetetrahydrofolate dehydrogenase (NADP+) / methenyltetrahydrofolate cyclohydrolase